MFLSFRWRAGWVDEGLQIDPIGDVSGGFSKGLHKILKLEVLLVHHSEILHLLFVHVLAMKVDE